MSHTISSRDRRIRLIHNGDWRGDVTIAVDRHPSMTDDRFVSKQDVPRHAEMIISAIQLISGDFERSSDCPLTEREVRRAVALAMYCYVTDHITEAVERCPAPGLL